MSFFKLPFVPLQPSSSKVEDLYARTTSTVRDLQKLIPQPNVPTSQTSELNVLIETTMTQLEDLRFRIDARSTEQPTSRHGFMKRLKGLVTVDQPLRQDLRDIKALSRNKERIEAATMLTTKRRKPISELLDTLDTHDFPESGTLGNLSDYPIPIETIRKMKKPSPKDKILALPEEAMAGSKLASEKYAKTRTMFMALVRDAVNCYIDAQTLKVSKSANELAQLSHWICFIVTQLGYYMGCRPDDSIFVIEIIPSISSLISDLNVKVKIPKRSKTNSSSSSQSERSVSDIRYDIEVLSGFVGDRMHFRSTSYDLEAKDDFVALIVDGEAMTIKKTDLTFSYLHENVLPKLRITVLEDSECKVNPHYDKKGSYGYVHQGEYKDKKMAFKFIHDDSDIPEWQLCIRFLRELYIWRIASYGPHIQPLRGIHLNSGRLPYMVSPWCSDSNLKNYRAGKSRLVHLKIMHQVSVGLAFLHSEKIVHGDLRSDNILVHDGVVRLTDFGISHTTHAYGFTSAIHGNPCWIAPELIDQTCHATYQADVFSFGRVLFHVLTGELPYERECTSNEGPKANYERVGGLVTASPAQHPTESVEIEGPGTADCVTLMHRCWEKDPALRPSAAHVQQEMAAIVEKCGT